MIQERRSSRIEAAIQLGKASANITGGAKTRIGINQTTGTTTEDTSESAGFDPVEIENEEATKSENILSGCLGFGDNLFRYQCSVCNNKTASLRSLLSHRQSVHHITQRPIKNSDLEPDADDPNYYCKSCEKHSNGWPAYRMHIHRIHHMDLKSLRRKRQPDSIIPGPAEPDYHCSLCELTCQNERTYQKHIEKHHEKKPSTANIRNSLGELPIWNDPSFHCAPCNFTYSSKKSYTQHCRHIHKMKPPEKPASATADVHNSKLYSKLRRSNSRTTATFKRHNKHIHERAYPEVMPDVMDPNNYCEACEKSYCDKGKYQKHLYIVHQINCIPVQDKEAKLDISDPNCYCHYCDKTFSRKTGLRNHLFAIHSIRQPDKKKDGLQPDVNDLNNYCRVCQRHYINNGKYRVHLRQIHQLSLERSKCFTDSTPSTSSSQ